MLEVLDTTKALYRQSSTKTLTISIPNKNITFTNGNIITESLSLKEKIESGDYLEFKGCYASQLKFSVANFVIDCRGEYIEATIKAGTSETIPLFSGYIVSQTNQTHEDIITEFECYDVLYKIRDLDVTAWYTGLGSSFTVKQFRDSFFSYLDTQFGYDIDQVVDVHSEDDTGDLVNDSLTLTKMDSAKISKVINAGYVLECICQANARYGQIGRDKKFHYRQMREIIKGLYPSYETFPSDETYPSGENADEAYNLDAYTKISYEPYLVEKIDGVRIVGNDGTSTSYGNDHNVFNIQDNLVAQTFSNKATACQNILGEVGVIWYIPSKVDCIGFPWVECGDIILTRTRKHIVRCYILQRTLKGIQSLFDTVESDGKQFRERYTESEETGISTNRNGVKENANEITATKLRVGTIEADYIKTAQLQAVDAKIDNLTAIAITTQNLSAQNISANQITSGTISANRISSSSITADKLDANSFSSFSLSCQSVSAGQSFYVGGYRYVNTPVTISGTGYNILARG